MVIMDKLHKPVVLVLIVNLFLISAQENICPNNDWGDWSDCTGCQQNRTCKRSEAIDKKPCTGKIT